MKNKITMFIPILLLIFTTACGKNKKKADKKVENETQASGPKYLDYHRVYLGLDGMFYTVPMRPPQKTIDTIVLEPNEKRVLVVPVNVDKTRTTQPRSPYYY